MAAYVITPSGSVLRYQAANHAVRGDARIELYESSAKKQWIADVPASWAVGWSQPRALGVDTAADELLANLRSAPGSPLARLKKALTKFDARTHHWKG